MSKGLAEVLMLIGMIGVPLGLVLCFSGFVIFRNRGVGVGALCLTAVSAVASLPGFLEFGRAMGGFP